MSRIGKLPITVPAGVEVTLNGNHVQVKGPKGTLEMDVHQDITVALENGVVTVARPSDRKDHRSLHGLTRALIANMVKGVTEGHSKTLDIVGVGYRAQMEGTKLVVNAGYSHPVPVIPPAGITFKCPAPNQIIIEGIDKQQVGQVAANIRSIREPEPYKGKGIKYAGEVIRRKAGKTGSK